MKNAILVPKKRNEYYMVGSMKTFVTDGRPDEGNLKGPVLIKEDTFSNNSIQTVDRFLCWEIRGVSLVNGS